MNKFLVVLLIAFVACETVTVIAKPDFNEFKEKLQNAFSWEEMVNLVLTYWAEYVASLCGPLVFVCKLLLQKVLEWLGL